MFNPTVEIVIVKFKFTDLTFNANACPGFAKTIQTTLVLFSQIVILLQSLNRCNTPSPIVVMYRKDGSRTKEATITVIQTTYISIPNIK